LPLSDRVERRHHQCDDGGRGVRDPPLLHGLPPDLPGSSDALISPTQGLTSTFASSTRR
jgi:hypothetical protein